MATTFNFSAPRLTPPELAYTTTMLLISNTRELMEVRLGRKRIESDKVVGFALSDDAILDSMRNTHYLLPHLGTKEKAPEALQVLLVDLNVWNDQKLAHENNRWSNT